MSGQEVDLWRCPCCVDWQTAGDAQYVPIPRWQTEIEAPRCKCGAPLVVVPVLDLSDVDVESDRREEALHRKFSNRYSRTNTDLAQGADLKNIEAESTVYTFLLASSDTHWTRLSFGRKPTDGWEFVHPFTKLTVKAYGARPGGNLLIKPREVYADYYVLVHTEGRAGDGEMVAWCPGKTVKRAQTQIMKWDGKYRQPSHFVAIRDMSKDWGALRQALGIAPRQESLL